ncbi:hypothetical protein A2U01_0050221, partial [Trifolium medium]|nr:hypothetical protein [Trifolium medium]
PSSEPQPQSETQPEQQPQELQPQIVQPEQPEPEQQIQPEPVQEEQPQLPESQSQPLDQSQSEPRSNQISTILPEFLRKIKIFQQETRPSEPTKPFIHSYQFILNSESDNELLMTQIHKDLQNLSALRDNLYAFPSDVTAEGEALKTKFAQSVDEFVKHVQDKMIED